MKSLSEAQVKVVNDFVKFKKDLNEKYNLIRTAMSIMENAFDEVLEKNDVNNKPSSISMTALIINDLQHGCRLEVDKDNMLTEGISKEVVEDKGKVIKICTDFISEISIHITELKKYVSKGDKYIFDKDIYECKQHINNIIKVIFEISE